MFFRKRPPAKDPTLRAEEIARRVLGPEARGEANLSFATSQRYPFLSGWGARGVCGYLVEGAWGGRRLSLAMPLQLYDREKDRKLAHYAFTGLCLQLGEPGWRGGEACIFSGRPFRAPAEAGWVKNPPPRRRETWSLGGTLSPGARERAAGLVNWLEDQAAAVLSARYELFLGNETASMVFWKPELHGLEGQLRIITELLDEVPPGA